MESDYIKESLQVKEFLDELLSHKESGEVEFKSARGGFPGSFWETYSSFANTNGGVVISKHCRPSSKRPQQTSEKDVQQRNAYRVRIRQRYKLQA